MHLSESTTPTTETIMVDSWLLAVWKFYKAQSHVSDGEGKSEYCGGSRSWNIVKKL
jgi:hypothetical protein